MRVGLSLDREDARLKFVEGWIDYKEENFSTGLEKMKVAWELLRPEEATFDERWVLVRALNNHGNAEDQRQAVRLLEEIVSSTEHVPTECIEMYCGMVILRRLTSSLRFVLSQIDEPLRALQIMRGLGEARVDPNVTYGCGMVFVRAWRRALDSDELEAELRTRWRRECDDLETRMKAIH